MSVKSPRHSANSLDERAAEWVARMDSRDLTSEEEAELTAWLQSDSRCLGALARARAIFISPGIASGLQTTSRLPLADSLRHRLTRRSLLTVAVAAAAASVIGMTVLLGHRAQTQTRIYSSEFGEVRQIPLEDGSRITLNTDSTLEVEYRQDSRVVSLKHGEAYFEVARNPQRPFIVTGSSAQARAVGTAYSVRVEGDIGEMRIRVMSGRVAVEPPFSEQSAPAKVLRRLLGAESTHSAFLNANQEAEVRVGKAGMDKGEIQVSIRELPADVFERSLMWREGMLSFEGVPLADAIAEFARYSRQKIEVLGPLAHERVSGLFAAADPAAFSRAVAISLKVKMRAQDGVITLYR